MKIGDKVLGRQLYGKANKLIGTITNIEGVTYQPQPGYRGEDIITIKWDSGTVARFHREDISENPSVFIKS